MALSRNAENLLYRIEDKIREFKISSDQTISNEKYKEERILESLKRLANSETSHGYYPRTDCKAYPFGSRTFFLTLPGTDFDIYLDCNNSYNTPFESGKTSTAYSTILRCLRSYSTNEWSDIQAFEDAQVPFIRCKNNLYGIRCDLTFGSGIGVEKSKLIRYFDIFILLNFLKLCSTNFVNFKILLILFITF